MLYFLLSRSLFVAKKMEKEEKTFNNSRFLSNFELLGTSRLVEVDVHCTKEKTFYLLGLRFYIFYICYICYMLYSTSVCFEIALVKEDKV